MIANSVTIYVFQGKFYIPTPAVHEIGSWETEPVAIVDFGDTQSFTKAIKDRIFKPEIAISRETMPKGFVSRKYTKHRSDRGFVSDADCWHFGIRGYFPSGDIEPNYSTEMTISRWGKRGSGYYNVSYSSLLGYNAEDIINNEVGLYSEVAELIESHYRRLDKAL